MAGGGWRVGWLRDAQSKGQGQALQGHLPQPVPAEGCLTWLPGIKNWRRAGGGKARQNEAGRGKGETRQEEARRSKERQSRALT